MSSPPEIVDVREIALFFQTNEPIPTRPLLKILNEVDRIAHSSRHLGPHALVEIVDITTGTKLVRLSVEAKIALGSLGVALASLASDLSNRIQQPSGRLAESIAELCLDHGVAECVITTSDTQVRITRDQIPAIHAVQKRRDRDEAIGSATPHSDEIPFSDGTEFSDGTGFRTASSRAGRVEDRLIARDAFLVLPSQAGDRLYTLVGRLRPPGDVGNSVPAEHWQFATLSGKVYIARGVDPRRTDSLNADTVVIQAKIVGREAGYIVLNVMDVFVSEEP